MKHFPRALCMTLALLSARCATPETPAGDASTRRDATPSRDTGTTSRDVSVVPPDTGLGCGGVRMVLTESRAEMILVIDRSNSMLEMNAAGGGTKWQSLQTALGMALPRVEGQISMGLVLFPGMGAANTNFMTACVASTALSVTPAFNQASEVMAAIMANPPVGSTPTNAGLRMAQAYFRDTPRDPDGAGARYVLLATDGAPNCNPMAGTPGSCRCSALDSCAATSTGAAYRCLDDTATLNTIRELAAQNITTFVVGLPGTESYGDVLDAMAVAGRAPRRDRPQYYETFSPAELVSAFGVIASSVLDCRFRLPRMPPDPSMVDVRLSGELLMRDRTHMNGWDYSDGSNQELQFFGATCERVRSASGGSVEAAFGCPDGT